MEAIMPIADKVVVLEGGNKIAEARQEIVEDEQVIKAYLGEKFANAKNDRNQE